LEIQPIAGNIMSYDLREFSSKNVEKIEDK